MCFVIVLKTLRKTLVISQFKNCNSLQPLPIRAPARILGVQGGKSLRRDFDQRGPILLVCNFRIGVFPHPLKLLEETFRKRESEDMETVTQDWIVYTAS